MSQKQPKAQGRKDKRKGNYRRQKARLYKTQKTCKWCEKEFPLNEMTLEHIIPLDRGGLDNPNNWALACEPCNSARANNMPELQHD